MDTDPDAPDVASLRGFSGAILGEFYGPGAEELGGVLNATRDLEGEDNDRTLTGFIGGKEPATSLDEMPVSAGVDLSSYSSAVLDRLLHHAETVTIEGRSFRMKDVCQVIPPRRLATPSGDRTQTNIFKPTILRHLRAVGSGGIYSPYRAP